MKDLHPGGWLRLVAIALGTIVLIPFQLAAMRFWPSRDKVVTRLFHKLVCRGLGVRTRVRGTPPSPKAGGLIVANHCSWLDIPVLGAQRPLSFVAKAEIAGWPVIGWLSQLQRTVFIDRTRRAATAGVADQMGRRLSAGELVVLFGEGTTGDGTRILPFRSSLVGAVHQALGNDDEAEIMIYPLTITYLGYHGMAGGRADRSALAWHGDTELAPHLAAMLKIGAIDVELSWGEPFAMGRAITRKQATRRLEAEIRRARNEAVTGRPIPPG